jgi:hypothetical protein
MPKLKGMQIRFAANNGGENVVGGNIPYRHRLWIPLWRWTTKKMMEKWGGEKWGGEKWGGENFSITTTQPEDYENVNMMGS